MTSSTTARAIIALLLALSSGLALLPAVSSAAPARPSAFNPVLAVQQSPTIITEQSAITVSIELASSTTPVNQVWLNFCQLSQAYCYTPAVTLTAQGNNWYKGTTSPMTGYSGMHVGIRAGYDIDVEYQNWTNVSLPDPSVHYPGLTLATSVTGTYYFEIQVSDQYYEVSGHVVDAATGAAVAGANVTLGPTNATSQTTDSSGSFAFSTVFNGSYTISVSRAGYRTTTDPITVSGQSAVESLQLYNSSGPPPPPPKTSSSPSFLSTPIGLATAGGIIGVVAIAAIVLTLRRRGGGRTVPPEPADPAGPPKSG